MATLPSNRSLFIPGKNYVGAHDGYRKDMQTIEIWGRQPIQRLIAGSGITLSPASGLATDARGNGPNPITISAAGGGGVQLAHVYPQLEMPGYPETFTQGTFELLCPTDDNSTAFTFGPFVASGGILVKRMFVSLVGSGGSSIGSGTATCNVASIYVSDATFTNYIICSVSGLPVSIFGQDITGFTRVFGAGAQLTLGTPQNTQLIKTTSNTTAYWVTVLMDLSGNGLGP